MKEKCCGKCGEFTKLIENQEFVNQAEGAEEKTDESNLKENLASSVSEQSQKGLKAKSTSLVAQIVASLWVAVWSGIKFFNGEGTTTDIILSGLAIAACFSPVYFNMLLDKIKAIRFGE